MGRAGPEMKDARRSRPVRDIVVQVLVIAGVGVAMFQLGHGYGDMPECGAGDYFLDPIFWIERLAVGGLVVCVAGASIIGLTRGPSTWIGPVLLVLGAVGGAMLGVAVAEAQNGCSRFRPDSQVLTAAYVVLPIALVCAVGALAVSGSRRVDGPAMPWGSGDPARVIPPPGMDLVGRYQVLGSGVQGLPPGTLIWAAVSTDELALLDAAGTPGLGLPRSDLQVALVGDTTRLRQADLDLLLLTPADGGAADALVRAVAGVRAVA
jgi:hypothetical protein